MKVMFHSVVIEYEEDTLRDTSGFLANSPVFYNYRIINFNGMSARLGLFYA